MLSLLYIFGVETWTLNTTLINKLEAFKLWLYRRISKIARTVYVTNELVLNMMRNRRYQLAQLIVQRKIESKQNVTCWCNRYLRWKVTATNEEEYTLQLIYSFHDFISVISFFVFYKRIFLNWFISSPLLVFRIRWSNSRSICLNMQFLWEAPQNYVNNFAQLLKLLGWFMLLADLYKVLLVPQTWRILLESCPRLDASC